MSNAFSRRRLLSGTGAAFTAGGVGALLAAEPAAAVARTGEPGRDKVGSGSSDQGGVFAFAHPGILHTQEDLDRMKDAVAAKRDPIYSGYLAMAADSRSSYDYTAHNTGQITSWGRGPSNYQTETPNDAAAAYQNTLMWYITGDTRHGDKARDILNVWSTSLRGITGADGQLGASLQGFKFVNAAEILRHCGYAGWAQADIEHCERSLRGVWYPAQSGYAPFANGNWETGAIRTTMGIAVFCDDRVMFEDAVRYATGGAGNGRITNRIVNATGQGQESGRDQTHEQLALGLLADAAQVAWNHGVDLFGFAADRILACYEYDTKYNLGNDGVPFADDLDRSGKYLKKAISATSRGLNRPIFELAYAHYVSVLGLPAPYTTQAVFRGTGGARFIEGYNEDHPSWGTLSCARSAPASSTPTAVPGAPSGLTAVNAADGVALSWAASVEPKTATAAATYTVKRAEADGGQYQSIATGLTTTEYLDLDASLDKTYTYTVQAFNAVGGSPLSLPARAAAGLPDGWWARDIGGDQPNGRTTFDGERFILEAGGSDIAGTADSFRFASLTLTGDTVITARVVFPVSSQYAKVGVMIRASLDPASAHAAMLIQGLPLYTWSGVWTTRATAGAAGTATGAVPVPAAQQPDITTGASFPLTDLGTLPSSATPLPAPYVEAAGDGYRMRDPYWVRLTRVGDTLTGSISPDGKTWTQVGSTQLDLGDTVYVGLAHCSCINVNGSYPQTGTAVFDNVTVTSSSPFTAPLDSSGLGLPGALGGGGRPAWAANPPPGVVTGLTATAGTGAIELSWSDPDPAARFVVKRSSVSGGPYRVIATDVGPVGFGVRTAYQDATGIPGSTYSYVVAKANVAGQGPDSAEAVAVMPTPSAPVIGSAPTAFGNTGEPFQYLIRASNNPTGFTATGLPVGLGVDGGTGLISGTPTATGTSTITIGAANATGTATAALVLTVGSPLPSPWAHQDVGDYVLDERRLGSYSVVSIRTPGTASYNSADESITVRGAGAGLNVNGQGMTVHYAYQPVSGDYTFVARIASRANAGIADQVGLIMTQSLSPFDQMAGVFLTSSGAGDTGTRQFVSRSLVAGGTSTTTGPSGVSTPTWLRLERAGNEFTAAAASDGSAWTTIGSATIGAFGLDPYYLGFAVTSNDPAALNTTVFDNVSITAGATAPLG